MGCCNTNEKRLFVTTINPIWRSRPVQPSTKTFNICSLKSKVKRLLVCCFVLLIINGSTQIKIKAMRCLVCVCFSKIIVCKDDVFLAFNATNYKKVCTRVYRMAMPNGIDCCNNQTLLIHAATTHFDWTVLKCCI